MEIMFKNVRCWDPTDSYSVFAPELGPVRIVEGTTSQQSLQIGPYRITVSIENNNLDTSGADGDVTLRFSNNQGIRAFAAGSGSVFISLDNVERMSSGGTLLGSARGCFDISW